MKQDQPVREFERYMRKEHGLVAHDTSETLVNTLRNAKLEHYANVIGSHVDDVLPKALLALGRRSLLKRNSHVSRAVLRCKRFVGADRDQMVRAGQRNGAES